MKSAHFNAESVVIPILRHIVMMFLMVFSTIAVFGQVNVIWDKTLGGTDYELSVRTIATSDSGFVACGSTQSGIGADKTVGNYGFQDIWMVKFDKQRNIEWQKGYGGSSWDAPKVIIQKSDGGFLLGCFSQSPVSGTKSDSCRGEWDLWLVRTDAAGNQLWDRTIGGNQRDELMYMQELSNGNLLMAIKSRSPVSGEKTGAQRGLYDYWVMETDSMGFIVWQRTLGGTLDDYVFAITPLSSGGYFVFGSSYSEISGDKTEPLQGGGGDRDEWGLHLDSAGINILSQFSINRLSTSLARVVLSDIDTILIAGSSAGYLRKFALNGADYTATSNYCSPQQGGVSQYMSDLQRTPDGGYLLGFYTTKDSCGLFKTENRIGNYDYWVIKYSSSFQKLWDKNLGGYKHDLSTSACQSLKNIVYVAGVSESRNYGGDKTENFKGGDDFWIVGLDVNTNLLKGNVFADMNANGVRDINETGLPYRKITNPANSQFTITNHNGDYKLHTTGTGLINIYSDTINYFSNVPAVNSGFFTGFYQTDSLNDFAVQPTGNIYDLCAQITPVTNFRNNQFATYIVSYFNKGTIPQDPTVVFYPDSNISFISAIPAPSAITGDSVVWNFGTLQPLQNRQIVITVKVDLGVPNGTVINSIVYVSPDTLDQNPGCNSASYEVFVTGSIDPNNMIVAPDTIFTSQLTNPPVLDYIINFQNIGNDTAFNVSVLTNISSKLDINTFELVSASHPMIPAFDSNSRKYSFRFPNILLPDKNTNEPLSHGFVRYRLRPVTTLTANDQIKDAASVYFDYNIPVITDTAVVRIVTPVSVYESPLYDPQFSIYPNPFTSEINMTFILSAPDSPTFHVSDIQGRPIRIHETSKLTAGKQTVTMDLSSLQIGIYFCTVKANAKTRTFKVVKF